MSSTAPLLSSFSASHPQGTSWLHVTLPLRGHGQLDQDMPCHLVDGDADIQWPGQPACGRSVCSLVCRMFIALAITMRQLLFFWGWGGGQDLVITVCWEASRVRPPSHLTGSLGPLSGLDLGLYRGVEVRKESFTSGELFAVSG